MKKEMTPMKRLSTNMQQLRKHLKPFFTEISLNKTESKYNYSSMEKSKGVDSDFLLIFESNENKQLSCAFEFSYFNLDVSQQKVTASIKNGPSNHDIISSMPLSLNDFKLILNEFNRWLELKTLNTKKNISFEIIDCFSDMFLQSKLDIENEIKIKRQELDNFIKINSENLKIPELTLKNNESTQILMKATKLLKNKLEETEEFKELEKVKKRMEFLEHIVEKNKGQFEKDIGLTHIERKANDANLKLMLAEGQLKTLVEKELKKSPKVIYSKIKI